VGMTTSQTPAGSLGANDNITVQVDRRRRAVADAWNLGDEVALIGARRARPLCPAGATAVPVSLAL
jgi:hypothetical protein